MKRTTAVIAVLFASAPTGGAFAADFTAKDVTFSLFQAKAGSPSIFQAKAWRGLISRDWISRCEANRRRSSGR